MESSIVTMWSCARLSYMLCQRVSYNLPVDGMRMAFLLANSKSTLNTLFSFRKRRIFASTRNVSSAEVRRLACIIIVDSCTQKFLFLYCAWAAMCLRLVSLDYIQNHSRLCILISFPLAQTHTIIIAKKYSIWLNICDFRSAAVNARV